MQHAFFENKLPINSNPCNSFEKPTKLDLNRNQQHALCTVVQLLRCASGFLCAIVQPAHCQDVHLALSDVVLQAPCNALQQSRVAGTLSQKRHTVILCG